MGAGAATRRPICSRGPLRKTPKVEKEKSKAGWAGWLSPANTQSCCRKGTDILLLASLVLIVQARSLTISQPFCPIASSEILSEIRSCETIFQPCQFLHHLWNKQIHNLLGGPLLHSGIVLPDGFLAPCVDSVGQHKRQIARSRCCKPKNATGWYCSYCVRTSIVWARKTRLF